MCGGHTGDRSVRSLRQEEVGRRDDSMHWHLRLLPRGMPQLSLLLGERPPYFEVAASPTPPSLRRLPNSQRMAVPAARVGQVVAGERTDWAARLCALCHSAAHVTGGGRGVATCDHVATNRQGDGIADASRAGNEHLGAPSDSQMHPS